MTSWLLHTALMCGFIVLQSVVFPAGLIRGAVPDLALILLCFSAHHHGSYRGELSGFAGGIVLDALSLAPLGFHALIRTFIGFLYGLFRGKIFIDPIFVPVVMVVVATIIKAILGYLLSAIFAPEIATTVFSERFGIELGLNAVIAPFFFALLKALGMVRQGRDQLSYE